MELHDWAGLELRHLIALQAVADERSFGRAADRLGYTQSAVSHQIAALESLVGQRLVERARGHRSVELTEAGALLARHAEAIVARLRAAQADYAAFAEGAAGVLRVGIYQSVGTRILPNLLREFAVAWPRVEVRLTESTSDGDLLSLVERGELDLTFTVFPVRQGPFEAVELLRDPYLLVVSASSILSRAHQPLRLEQLADVPLIGPRMCISGEQLETRMRGYGVEPRVIFRSDDNGTVQGLVGAGVGAALLPRLAIDPTDRATRTLTLDPEVAPRIICLAWHRDRYRSPAARAFVDTARLVCADVQFELDRSESPATANEREPAALHPGRGAASDAQITQRLQPTPWASGARIPNDRGQNRASPAPSSHRVASPPETG
jgi:DNA-binding transcriptional LysR family regulator